MVRIIEISEYDDAIDMRDVIREVEDLRALSEDGDATIADQHKLEELESLLADLAGNGGDEKWEGNWYPLTLIRDSYFTDYAQELCEDIGDVPRDMPSYLVIDWEATVRNIRMDYTSTEFRGVTYWYR